MKDRSRNTRRAPARALFAYLVDDGGDTPEEATCDLVYAHDEDHARQLAFAHGESGRALRDGWGRTGPSGGPVTADDLNVRTRWSRADRFARAPGIEGDTANLRLAGLQWCDEASCGSCGLSSTGEAEGPWAVCGECDQCGECGHDEECAHRFTHLDSRFPQLRAVLGDEFPTTLCGELVESETQRFRPSLTIVERAEDATCEPCRDRHAEAARDPSYAEIARRHGYTADELFDRVKRERALAESYGLLPGGDA